MNEQYSTVQRVAFAAVTIGFLLFLTGGAAPYWQKASLNLNNVAGIFGKFVPGVGDIKLSKFHGGIAWYCVEVPLMDEMSCDLYDLNKGDVRTYSMILCVLASIVLAFACMVGACCRLCCCGGGKTICHGIMTFLAGACGIAAVALFVTISEDSWGMKLSIVTYGWAFYVYIAGVVCMVPSSFILCCASPESPILVMVANGLQSTGVISAHTASTYRRFGDDMHPLAERNSP